MTTPKNAYADGEGLRAIAELHAAEEYARLQAAAAITDAETEESVVRVLVAAHEHLGMAVAFIGRFTASEHVVQHAHGDARSFGLEPGTTIPLGEAYCQRVIDGRLPSLVTDAQRDVRVADLALIRYSNIGAYVSVPVRFEDGRLYGTLWCASHTAASWLSERDVAFLRVLGRMLISELERGAVERAARRQRDEAIALGALFAGLDARDSDTGRHSEDVVKLTVHVTRKLGLPESVVEEVEQVALLHDIGKIGIPDAILGKQGPLDEQEWVLMHEHPVIGARIVASVDALAHLAPAVRAEHERCDGKGYPDGLTRDQIPLASRITFACDAYDAMISSRPYRSAMNATAAAAELRHNAGTQFDPDVVAALLWVLDR